MKSLYYRTARSLLAGNFNGNTVLDTTVNVDPLYQHPAVSPNIVTIPATTYNASDVGAGTFLSGSLHGTGWVTDGLLCYTPVLNDYFQFTVPSSAAYIGVYITGIMTLGMGETLGDTGLFSATLRNGCLATVTVDGTVVATVNTYNQIAFWSTTFTPGSTHVVKITQSGTYGPGLNPVSNIVSTVGLSVVPSVTPNPPAGFVAASWRIHAVTSGTYSLYTTPLSTGVEVQVGTTGGFNTATNYSSSVTGCTLNVAGPLTAGNEATFQTDQLMLGVIEIDTATSYSNPGGSYTSAVVDSAVFLPDGNVVDPGTNTMWVALRWVQDYLPTSIVFETGNSASLVSGVLTLNHDSSYSSTTVTPLQWNLPSGTIIGVAGLQQCPAGRYARWTFNFQTSTVNIPFFREAVLYWVNPNSDAGFLDTIAGTGQYMRVFDVNSAALLCTIGVMLRDYLAAKDDLIASYSISNSVDQYLAAYGAAQGLPQYTGEPPESYQTRVGSSYASKSHGGSIGFVCAQVAQLVNGSPQVITAPTFSGSYAYVYGGGVTVAQAAGRAFAVFLPPPQAAPLPPYPGLPGLSLATAQQLITNHIVNKLRPVGSPVTIFF